MSDKKTAGMYEVGNKDWQQVKVGRFIITRQDDNSVWIEDEGEDGGDGAQFSDESFEYAIKEFYDKNF